MVVQNLLNNEYQSREAKMFFLKQRADLVSDFIRGLRKTRSQVYQQIMAGVSGVNSLVTLESLLLQITLYFRKFSTRTILEVFEVDKAHSALSTYYRDGDFSPVISYLKEVKDLFNLVKE